MEIEIVEYHGWKNNLAIRNKQIELIVTLDVGPRVISFRRLPDGQNVMKNYEEMLGKSGRKNGRSEAAIASGWPRKTAPEPTMPTTHLLNSRRSVKIEFDLLLPLNICTKFRR